MLHCVYMVTQVLEMWKSIMYEGRLIVGMEVKRNTFTTDAIKDLEIRVTVASVEVRSSEDALIRVEAENLQDMDYTCQVRNQKLVVIYGLEGRKHLVNFNLKEAEIILYLPQGKTFEHIELEIGAGSINMKDVPVLCKDMEAEIGAGKWRVAYLKVSERLDLQIGAGEVKMKSATVGTLNLECGVGSYMYKGCVTKDIKVDCGVGNCKFELENKESDFNYDVFCALGNVKINKSSIRCMGSKKIYSDRKAKGTATLKCGLGNIELDTNEKEEKGKVALEK